MLLPTGARPGDHMEFTMSGSGTTAHVTINVLRDEPVVIGSQTVNTLAIHTVASLSGRVSGTQSSDTWVSPELDLVAKEHIVNEATSSGLRAHTDQTSTLQSLVPA
jgi:hypothetical protein